MKLNAWLDSELSGVVSSLYSENLNFTKKERMLGTAGKEKVYSVIFDLRSALFPGVYESVPIDENHIDIFIGNKIRQAAMTLAEVIERVLYSVCTKQEKDTHTCTDCRERAAAIVSELIGKLPEIRELLGLDIDAAYRGDPAALYGEEILLSYPFIEAVTIHRISHILYRSRVPVIPRIMNEYAHRQTGIDIHPGAEIGKSFFIDHGTGVVIGETCRIGDNVKLYQGVTLGARSFAVGDDGVLVKGIKRHPDIEDNVIIYSGASILGGDTVIGHDSVIGGNVFMMQSVPPYSKVFYSTQTPPVIRQRTPDGQEG